MKVIVQWISISLVQVMTLIMIHLSQTCNELGHIHHLHSNIIHFKVKNIESLRGYAIFYSNKKDTIYINKLT